MPATPLRFGILGAARIAPAALIRPAAKNEEVVIEAVAARDRDRATAYAKRHRIARVADSYQGLVSDPGIDAVYIPLPNSLHGKWTLAALAGGKHVLCEKPMTANADEAEVVAAAARRAAQESGLVLAEAFHYRYHPLAHRMREVLDSGDLGRVREIEAWLCAPIPKKSDIRYQNALAGGAMMDMGCYVVNMARMLSGEEPEVREATAKLQSADVDRAMSAVLEFPGGHIARVHCSMWSSSVLHVAAKVTGDKGEMRVFNPLGPSVRQLDDPSLRRLPAHRICRATVHVRLPARRVLRCGPAGSPDDHDARGRGGQHARSSMPSTGPPACVHGVADRPA